MSPNAKELIPQVRSRRSCAGANPLHYFRRTALTDTTLAGQRIRAGDKVAMYYTSANRDDTVFDDPQAFDITRDPNPHLSFGIGPISAWAYIWPGSKGGCSSEELLRRWPSIELAGEPVRQHSNLNNTLKRLPVRLG